MQPVLVALAVSGEFGAIRAAANEMERWRMVSWVGLIEVGTVLTDPGAS